MKSQNVSGKIHASHTAGPGNQLLTLYFSNYFSVFTWEQSDEVFAAGGDGSLQIDQGKCWDI